MPSHFRRSLTRRAALSFSQVRSNGQRCGQAKEANVRTQLFDSTRQSRSDVLLSQQYLLRISLTVTDSRSTSACSVRVFSMEVGIVVSDATRLGHWELPMRYGIAWPVHVEIWAWRRSGRWRLDCWQAMATTFGGLGGSLLSAMGSCTVFSTLLWSQAADMARRPRTECFRSSRSDRSASGIAETENSETPCS